jgi:hypothetical protein
MRRRDRIGEEWQRIRKSSLARNNSDNDDDDEKRRSSGKKMANERESEGGHIINASQLFDEEIRTAS